MILIRLPNSGRDPECELNHKKTDKITKIWALDRRLFTNARLDTGKFTLVQTKKKNGGRGGAAFLGICAERF